jgi:hypothetical protein
MTNNNLKYIYNLAKAQKKIQDRADNLKISETRELLECEHCGLLEDYTFKSGLITYIKDSNIGTNLKDSGLRFKATDNPELFVCPVCSNTVKVPNENIDE